MFYEHVSAALHCYNTWPCRPTPGRAGPTWPTPGRAGPTWPTAGQSRALACDKNDYTITIILIVTCNYVKHGALD